MPWLTWRSRAIASLYTELAEAAQAASPGSVLAVVTPGLDEGPAGTEARRVDRAGLAPSQAWRSVGLDLQAWPRHPAAPPVFRGVVLSTDALGHDLATSPDLDALVAGRAQRGLLLTIHDDPPALCPASPARRSLRRFRPRRATPISSAPSSDPARSAHSLRYSRPEHQPPATNRRNLADGLAARQRSGRRRAPGTCDRRPRCALGLPGGQGRRRSGRTAPPLCQRSSRTAGLASGSAHCPGRSQSQALRCRGPAHERRCTDLPGNRQRFPVSDPSGWLARCARLGTRRRPWPRPPPFAGGRGRRSQPGSRPAPLWCLGNPRRSTTRSALRGHALSVRAVLTTMQSRFNELSAQLARLNHGLPRPRPSPRTPRFELQCSISASPSPAVATTTPAGWRLEAKGTGSSTIAIDR